MSGHVPTLNTSPFAHHNLEGRIYFLIPLAPLFPCWGWLAKHLSQKARDRKEIDLYLYNGSPHLSMQNQWVWYLASTRLTPHILFKVNVMLICSSCLFCMGTMIKLLLIKNMIYLVCELLKLCKGNQWLAFSIGKLD